MKKIFSSLLEKTITLKIHGIGSHGEGVGYHEGFTLFVEGALPDETVEVEIFEKHKRYARAKLVRVLEPSSHRITPPCPLFGTCGGCQIMHLSYEKQLLIKQQKVQDALERIGKILDVQAQPCVPSPVPFTYRNKIQIPIKQQNNQLQLGLYTRNTHDLVAMSQCLIHSEIGQQVYEDVLPLIKASSLSAYDPITEKGELRHLLIKSSLYSQKALLIFVTSTPPTSSLKKLAAHIMAQTSHIEGIIHNLNPATGNAVLGTHYTPLEGQDHIEEKINGLIFKVSPASFFQVNPLQAEALYQKVLECAALTGNERVLDAFCGVGTLSLILAKQAKEVVGIECVPEAITDARINAKLNQITNVSFECGDVTESLSKDHLFDVMILNPPRKGCDPEFLEKVKKIQPKKIVYVSCDPATLARDLALLLAGGYTIDLVQPFDMFPQTAHVETCVSLSLH